MLGSFFVFVFNWCMWGAKIHPLCPCEFSVTMIGSSPAFLCSPSRRCLKYPHLAFCKAKEIALSCSETASWYRGVHTIEGNPQPTEHRRGFINAPRIFIHSRGNSEAQPAYFLTWAQKNYALIPMLIIVFYPFSDSLSPLHHFWFLGFQMITLKFALGKTQIEGIDNDSGPRNQILRMNFGIRSLIRPMTMILLELRGW